MRRSRGRDLSLGVAVVLANVLLVVGVVALATGRVGSPTATPTSPTGLSSSTSPRTPTAPPTTAPPTSTPAQAVSALLASGKDVTIAVLGDGTGDEEGEWVSAFASQAADTHQVTVRGLDPNDPTQYVSKRSYGSDGPKVTVWNGSRSGASAGYPAQRLGFLAPTEPDVVLLSFGRDNTARNITADLEKTYQAIRSRWGDDVPVAVVLQGQDRDDLIGPVRAMAQDWAESHGLPQIDVAAAFAKAGDPNDFVSQVDPPSVNARGGTLWGRTVLRALGGTAA